MPVDSRAPVTYSNASEYSDANHLPVYDPLLMFHAHALSYAPPSGIPGSVIPLCLYRVSYPWYLLAQNPTNIGCALRIWMGDCTTRTQGDAQQLRQPRLNLPLTLHAPFQANAMAENISIGCVGRSGSGILESTPVSELVPREPVTKSFNDYI